MKINFQYFIFPIFCISIFLLSSCIGLTKIAPASSAQVTQMSTILIKNTPSITITFTKAPTYTPYPSPTSTPTITPTPDICNPAQWNEDKMLVLSNDLFDALRPGGSNTFDRILITQNPAWEDFQQEIEDMAGELWTAGQIFDSFAWGYELGTGVNPAVILVTYGVEYDWELPKDGDLVSKVDQIRAQLHNSWGELVRKEIDLSQYPQIANGATYTLYRYFDGDKNQLETWCRTYVYIYGESPLEEWDH